MYLRMSFKHLVLLPLAPKCQEYWNYRWATPCPFCAEMETRTSWMKYSTKWAILPDQGHTSLLEEIELRSFVPHDNSPRPFYASGPTLFVSRSGVKRDSRGWGLKLTNWAWCWVGELSGGTLEGTRLEGRQGVSGVISSQEREFGTEITTLLFCKPNLWSPLSIEKTSFIARLWEAAFYL